MKKWEGPGVTLAEREAVVRRFYDEWAAAEESPMRWDTRTVQQQIEQLQGVHDLITGKRRHLCMPYRRMLERILRAEGFEVPE